MHCIEIERVKISMQADWPPLTKFVENAKKLFYGVNIITYISMVGYNYKS